MLTRARARTSNSIHTFVCFRDICTVLVLSPGLACSAARFALSSVFLHPEPEASLEARHANTVHSEECDCDKENNAFTSHHPIF